MHDKNTKMGRKRVHHPWSLDSFDDGYIKQERFFVYFPDHPRADKRGYIQRSIVAFEAYHPYEVVSPNMIVHHIDENSLNDLKENLEIVTRKEHQNHHLRVPRAKRVCDNCGVEFFILRYRLNDKTCNRGRFCSLTCFHAHRSRNKKPSF